MSGLIGVTVHDGEPHYTYHCSCGWEGPGEESIEMCELSLLGHFDRMHRTEVAA